MVFHLLRRGDDRVPQSLHDVAIHRDEGLQITFVVQRRRSFLLHPNPQANNRRPKFPRRLVTGGSGIVYNQVQNLIVLVQCVGQLRHFFLTDSIIALKFSDVDQRGRYLPEKSRLGITGGPVCFNVR